MKNGNSHDFKNSDFWRILVEKVNAILNDMENFNYTAQLYEEKIKNIDQQLLSFVWAMKFIAFEEEIVDSRKKSDFIVKLLGDEVIEKFIYNKTNIFKTLSPFNSLVIKEPDVELNDTQHNPRWILGVIKKCIAHGNFSFDVNRGVLSIENNEYGNELNCEVGCYWLAQLGKMISPERTELLNNTQLNLTPYMFFPLRNQIKNRDELKKYLRSNEFVCYYPMLIYLSGTPEQQLTAKKELNDFWMSVVDARDIIEKMPDMTKTVENGKIRLVGLGEEHHNRIISELENIRDFYSMSANVQTHMFELVMYDIGCVELGPSQSHNIDFGLDLLGNQIGQDRFLGYIDSSVKRGKNIHPESPEIFANISYKYGNYKKKMALAYMLGILLFAGNKDDIYDELVDYDSFDLSQIVAYDFSTGKEIEKVINNIKNDITILENGPTHKKLEKKINNKKEKLSEFKSKLIDMTDGIPKTRPSNKEIFHRIRNAFSHKQIYNIYNNNFVTDIADSTDKDQLVLVDEDKFIAYINIDDLLKLLMDEKFYKALLEKENNYGKSLY